LLLETWSDFSGLAALAKIQRYATAPALPLLLSLTYRRLPTGEIETVDGYRPQAVARMVRGYPLTVLGVNCGRDLGMDEILEVVHRYRDETNLPLLVRPNAGTPAQVEGRPAYPRTPAAMAARLPELLVAGVALVGGCCGTTPEHIAAFRPIVEQWNG
jgi:5-methyltetrahydrofolate--homocysteine methyltransferase